MEILEEALIDIEMQISSKRVLLAKSDNPEQNAYFEGAILGLFTARIIVVRKLLELQKKGENDD